MLRRNKLKISMVLLIVLGVIAMSFYLKTASNKRDAAAKKAETAKKGYTAYDYAKDAVLKVPDLQWPNDVIKQLNVLLGKKDFDGVIAMAEKECPSQKDDAQLMCYNAEATAFIYKNDFPSLASLSEKMLTLPQVANNPTAKASWTDTLSKAKQGINPLQGQPTRDVSNK